MDAQFWNDLGMELLRAIVPVLVAAVPALAAALLALAVQQIRLIQAKIQKENPTQYQKITQLCEGAVLVAEQLNIAGLIEDRKKYAIEYVQKYANQAGIEVDVLELADEIEKAVFTQLTSKKLAK